MPNVIGIYRFFWEGATYILTKTHSIEFELIMCIGIYVDEHTKIEKSIHGTDNILTFLKLRCVPLKNYFEIEKIFIEEET